MKDANKDSLCLLEKKKIELNMAQSETQTLRYEQSATASKVRYSYKIQFNHFFSAKKSIFNFN